MIIILKFWKLQINFGCTSEKHVPSPTMLKSDWLRVLVHSPYCLFSTSNSRQFCDPFIYLNSLNKSTLTKNMTSEIKAYSLIENTIFSHHFYVWYFPINPGYTFAYLTNWYNTSLPSVIVKYDLPINEWALLHQALWRCLSTKWAVIARNLCKQ